MQTAAVINFAGGVMIRPQAWPATIERAQTAASECRDMRLEREAGTGCSIDAQPGPLPGVQAPLAHPRPRKPAS